MLLDTLLSGRFTVLGKVTRVVQDEEEISLYQRSTLRYFVNSADLESAFAGFALISSSATSKVVENVISFASC
jgi:hypothetical protein